jgi:hypothetical protein
LTQIGQGRSLVGDRLSANDPKRTFECAMIDPADTQFAIP